MPFTHPTAGAAMAGPRSRETGQVHRGRRGFLSSASALAAVTVAAPVAAAVTTCRKGVRRAALGVALAMTASAALAAPVLWDTASGGNGHWYEIRAAATWADALAAADASTHLGLDGYLVTLTSLAEEQFIYSNVSTATYWFAGSDTETEGVWKWMAGPELGQVFWTGGPGGAAPSGAYANWFAGEPNQFGGNEDFALANWSGLSWNDGQGEPWAYVVEYSRAPGVGGVPEPGTWALMLLGFAGAGAMLRRRGSPARRLRPA